MSAHRMVRDVSSRRPPLRLAETAAADHDIRIEGVLYELIPPGEYEAFGVGCQTLNRYGTLKLKVDFDVLVDRINTFEPTVRLARFYNLKRAAGGRFNAAAHGDYLREWTIATGRRPTRRDRMSARVFEKVCFKVEVATVERDYRQRSLSELLKYSKIARVISRSAGGTSR